MRLTLAAPAVALLTSATASAAPEPRLDMLAFFTGKTHAENVMKVAFHRPKRLVVDSVGGKTAGGEFVLIDTVHEEGKPVRMRKWVMRAVGAGRFTGALSDAVGPVEVIAEGDSAIVRYTMKENGVKVVQRMQLRGDGKTLSNHVIARRFGLKFASVDGTIRKLD